MSTTRQILDLLSRDELVEIVDRRDIIVADRRAKGHLVGRIEEKAVPLADVLAGLSRDRLKELFDEIRRRGHPDAVALLERLGEDGIAHPEALLAWGSVDDPTLERPPQVS